MREKDPESRGWILTLPFAEYDRAAVEEGLGRYTAYVGQHERGEETGYEHWQVYLEHATPVRFSTLHNLFPKGHFERRQGIRAQAVEYVTKEETRVGDRIEHGHIDVTTRQGQRSDLEELHGRVMAGESVDDLLMNDHRALLNHRGLRELQTARDNKTKPLELRGVKAFYLYGETRTGKTSYLFDQYGDEMFRVSSYKHPYDAYSDQPVLVLDDFSSQVPMDLMLNILDIYPMQLPCRYRDKWADFETVWVVSNLPLERQYTDVRDRCPEQWEAFRARFSQVYCMTADGMQPEA